VRRQGQTVAWLVDQFDQFCTIELPTQHKNPKWGERLLPAHIEKRLNTLPLSSFTANKLWECLDPLRTRQPATARHVYGAGCWRRPKIDQVAGWIPVEK
jgi:hypothetical protein